MKKYVLVSMVKGEEVREGFPDMNSTTIAICTKANMTDTIPLRVELNGKVIWDKDDLDNKIKKHNEKKREESKDANINTGTTAERGEEPGTGKEGTKKAGNKKGRKTHRKKD